MLILGLSLLLETYSQGVKFSADPRNSPEFWSPLRNDIKSYGKFAIFSKLKMEGGWVKRANYGKYKTKDRNFLARDSRDFGKIRLKIEGGGCLGVYL